MIRVRVHAILSPRPGGYGYMVEFPYERELRDAVGGQLYSGTSEIQRNIIAKCMGL